MEVGSFEEARDCSREVTKLLTVRVASVRIKHLSKNCFETAQFGLVVVKFTVDLVQP